MAALGRALLALRGLAAGGGRRGLAALNHPDRFDVMGEAGAVKVTGCVPPRAAGEGGGRGALRCWPRRCGPQRSPGTGREVGPPARPD